jgi:tRNA (guanine37-N1)-methyltransferase
MRIGFVALFPELIQAGLSASMANRARERGLVSYQFVSPRDFAADQHKTVDDKPYGGGPGMVMMPDIVDRALQSLAPFEEQCAVVVPDPCGKRFSQSDAIELAMSEDVIFVCGHYEGIDERFVSKRATHRFSLGDFVMTGGEIPALAMADAIIRLIPGVLGDADSLEIDSHSDGLLSAPQYTRPETWEGMEVPEVLRSGDHGAIAKWKRRIALQTTRELRPDLLALALLEKGDADMLSF